MASGLFPATAGARPVAEKLGIRYVYAAYCLIVLPSPHHLPLLLPGRRDPQRRGDGGRDAAGRRGEPGKPPVST